MTLRERYPEASPLDLVDSALTHDWQSRDHLREITGLSRADLDRGLRDLAKVADLERNKDQIRLR